MALRKFIQWTDHYSEKISLFHVILLSCLFALISIVNHHGGILNSEMFLRLPFYLSGTPLINKLFDSMILDADYYRARELSYFLDFIDSKFIEFSIEHGFPHFLSLIHYLFSIATGCLLWLFCVKELKLKSLIGICWLVLFWTSPSIFLGGLYCRAGKMSVALLIAILFYVIYKAAVISTDRINSQISKKVWFLYFITIFTITFLDEQGLFFAIAVIVFLTIWGLFVRNKNIYMMLLIGFASILFHLLYRYTIAPQLTFMLNEYWPNFNYQTLPIQYFIQNLASKLSAGLFLYIETFRYLIGNPPRMMGLGLLLFFIFFPVYYLFTRSELSGNSKKFFILAFVELLITNLFMVIVMNALMVLKLPLLMQPDITLTYYWLPENVMLSMTLAVMTGIFYKSRIPKWLMLIVLCSAIMGNIAALPKHKEVIRQGYVKSDIQPSSDLLNALNHLDSLNVVHGSLIEQNPVFQFFKSKKKNSSTEYGANVYIVRGVTFAERGQYQRAIENYNMVILLQPDAKIYINRGGAYAKLGRYRLAIEDFNKAIGFNKDLAEAYYNRGCIYANLGQHKRAIEDYNKSIRLKPDYVDAYYNRGCSYSSLSQHQQAIRDYNEAIRLKPDDADSYYNRALAHFALGNRELGHRDAQKACSLGECKL
jgi:tetratricopeptide (TPR) repeat protein